MPDIGTVESTLTIIVALGGMMGWMWKSITARIDRDLKDLNEAVVDEEEARKEDIADVRHSMKNLAMKHEALATKASETIERVVKTETTVLHMKDALDRTDKNVLELLKIQKG